jgi:hypothetical protein
MVLESLGLSIADLKNAGAAAQDLKALQVAQSQEYFGPFVCLM